MLRKWLLWKMHVWHQIHVYKNRYFAGKCSENRHFKKHVDTTYVQNHHFEGKCSENRYCKMHVTPTMYKNITLERHMPRKLSLGKCIWHQICTKSLLCRQMLRKSVTCKMCLTPNMYKNVTLKANAKEIVTLKCMWHHICTKSLLWRQMPRKSSLVKCVSHQMCIK